MFTVIKQKMNIKCVLCSLIVLFIISQSVYGEINRPVKNFVYDFYMWYCHELLKNTPRYPLFNDAIYKYVDRCTIDRLRIDYRRKIIDTDYFIKVNDFWSEMIEKMSVDEEIYVSELLSIVPIIFNVEIDKQHIIFVFIKKENDSLSIIKVEDSYTNF